MEVTPEWKMEGGHTLQPHSLGTVDVPPTQISESCLGLGGGTKVFYLPRPDYRRFKIPSFTSPGHTHGPVSAPTATFSFSRIVGNPLASRSRAIVICFSNYALPYILAISYNPRKKLFLLGGDTHGLGFGGGGHMPPGPPGFGTGTVLLRSLGGVLGIKYLHVFNFASYIKKISLL